MSKLSRYLQRVFCSNYKDTPSAQIAQFGSAAAGSPAYTGDPAQIQALDRYLNGWLAGVVGNKSPSAQDFNGLLYMITHQLAYAFQEGVPEYQADTTYFQYGIAKYNGVIYQATATAAEGFSGIVPTNRAYWLPYSEVLATSMPGVAKAWGHFTDDGTTCTLVTSHNITDFVRLSTGNYRATIATGVLTDSSYCYSFGNEQDDSGGSVQVLTRFPGDLKTPTTFQFRNVNTTNSAQYRVTEGAFTIWR